jgi:hypothetical protein
MLIKSFESYEKIKEVKIIVDDTFNKKLYNIFKQPTFVFIRKKHYDLLNPRLQQECKALGEDDMTVDEMLAENILYAITVDNSSEEINEIVELVEAYTKQPLKYLILEV